MTDKDNKTSDLAKSIWLAGLGAYGKAFDEAQVRYEKVSKETSRLFDELVAKGRALEGDTQEILHETREKIQETKDKTTSSLEERIGKVRQSLGFSDATKESRIDDLSKKVDELSMKLDAVLDALGANDKPKAKATKLPVSSKPVAE